MRTCAPLWLLARQLSNSKWYVNLPSPTLITCVSRRVSSCRILETLRNRTAGCGQRPQATRGQSIYRKRVTLDNCWGFISGTVRPVARPGEHQRVLYNGHNRVHSIKFQSVVAPNGLIVNLFGPVEGRRHDSGMLAMSGLLPMLETLYSGTPL